jgi:hypothetical protein
MFGKYCDQGRVVFSLRHTLNAQGMIPLDLRHPLGAL